MNVQQMVRDACSQLNRLKLSIGNVAYTGHFGNMFRVEVDGARVEFDLQPSGQQFVVYAAVAAAINRVRGTELAVTADHEVRVGDEWLLSSGLNVRILHVDGRTIGVEWLEEEADNDNCRSVDILKGATLAWAEPVVGDFWRRALERTRIMGAPTQRLVRVGNEYVTFDTDHAGIEELRSLWVPVRGPQLINLKDKTKQVSSIVPTQDQQAAWTNGRGPDGYQMVEPPTGATTITDEAWHYFRVAIARAVGDEAPTSATWKERQHDLSGEFIIQLGAGKTVTVYAYPHMTDSTLYSRAASAIKDALKPRLGPECAALEAEAAKARAAPDAKPVVNPAPKPGDAWRYDGGFAWSITEVDDKWVGIKGRSMGRVPLILMLTDPLWKRVPVRAGDEWNGAIGPAKVNRVEGGSVFHSFKLSSGEAWTTGSMSIENFIKTYPDLIWAEPRVGDTWHGPSGYPYVVEGLDEDGFFILETADRDRNRIRRTATEMRKHRWRPAQRQEKGKVDLLRIGDVNKDAVAIAAPSPELGGVAPIVMPKIAPLGNVSESRLLPVRDAGPPTWRDVFREVGYGSEKNPLPMCARKMVRHRPAEPLRLWLVACANGLEFAERETRIEAERGGTVPVPKYETALTMVNLNFILLGGVVE